MITVFARAMIGFRTGLALVSLGLFAISVVVVYVLEAFGGFEAVEQVMQFMPEAFQSMLEAQGGFATNAQGFLAADYRHPVYLLAVAGFVVAVSAGSVSREIERGTVLMILAAPLARWKFLLGKMAAMLIGVVVILAVSVLGTWTGMLLTGIHDDVSFGVFPLIQVNTLALALAIGGISMLLSAWGNDGGQTTGIAAGIIAAMYFLDFLAGIWSAAAPFGPLSLFHYFDPLSISEAGALPWDDLAVLFGVALAGLVGALAIFQRRDIAR